MRLSERPRCRRVPACLDYEAYVFDIPVDQDRLDRQRIHRSLEPLGRVDGERLGVVYIRSDWGHMVLPPVGFPELKVVFHHGTSARTRQRILDLMAAAIAEIPDDRPE